jgi:hypothetical protein
MDSRLVVVALPDGRRRPLAGESHPLDIMSTYLTVLFLSFECPISGILRVLRIYILLYHSIIIHGIETPIVPEILKHRKHCIGSEFLLQSKAVVCVVAVAVAVAAGVVVGVPLQS